MALKDSRTEQGATLRQLSADVDLIKLSLSQKADRGAVQVMVDDAIGAREFARGSQAPVACNETVPLSAPTDPLPPLAPAPPASLIVKWDEDARLATVSLGMPAACAVDEIIDVSEEPEGAEDSASRASEETNMIWM